MIMQNRQLVIGCDSAAYVLMKELCGYLKENGYSYEEIGVESPDDPLMYPVIAKRAADKIISSGYTKSGVLLCGTGIGMSIAANKFKGIYAAVCHDCYSAERACLSNNVNVLCMGAKIIAPEHAKRLLHIWLNLEFVTGPSLEKIQKIMEYENA